MSQMRLPRQSLRRRGSGISFRCADHPVRRLPRALRCGDRLQTDCGAGREPFQGCECDSEGENTDASADVSCSVKSFAAYGAETGSVVALRARVSRFAKTPRAAMESAG